MAKFIIKQRAKYGYISFGDGYVGQNADGLGAQHWVAHTHDDKICGWLHIARVWPDGVFKNQFNKSLFWVIWNNVSELYFNALTA